MKGRRGFRFIYILDAERQLILGVMLSSDLRSNFDYDDPTWMERAELIYQDLVDSQPDAFANLKLAY